LVKEAGFYVTNYGSNGVVRGNEHNAGNKHTLIDENKTEISPRTTCAPY
jgi:hypothetical protein